MKKRCVVALGLLGAAVAATAMGFPKRIGVTASQAAVSLPGDLLVPNPAAVVDRGIRIDAPLEAVWRVLDAAYEGDEARVVTREENSCLLLRVPSPGCSDEDDLSGTCVFALMPLPNGRTLVHLRERHVSREDISDRLLGMFLALESVSTMRMLHDIRAAACA